MRVSLGSLDLEVRVQHRRVTFVEVFHKGKMIASDVAIHNPLDVYDPKEGEETAVGRVAPAVAKYWAKNNEVTKSFQGKIQPTTNGVIRVGNYFLDMILEKLEKRRERKAQADTKAAEKLVYERGRELLDKFYSSFPLVPKGSTGRFSFSQPRPWDTPRPR